MIALLVAGVALLAAAVAFAANQPPASLDGVAQSDPTPEPRGAAIMQHILVDDPYTEWASWPTDALNPEDYSGYLPSDDPHGSAVRIFVNGVALNALAGAQFDGELPPGSMIVKENYAVTRDNPAAFVALTVMVKIDGFNPAGGDWFWLKAAPDGSAIDVEGAVSGCIDCHAASPSDYLLRYTLSGASVPDAEALIDTRCTVCHTRERIDAASKDVAGWTATVDRMIGYGAQLSASERDLLIAHLAGRGATVTVDPNDPEMIINVRCTVCHTRARIDDEEEDLEDWTEIVNRMIGYGAQLTPQEKQTLISYLVATHGKDSDDDDSGRGRGHGRGRGGDD